MADPVFSCPSGPTSPRPSLSRFVSPLVLGALGAIMGTACTAILKPRDDVQRCGTADDCKDTGDNRYVAECRFDAADEGHVDSTKVSKICVANFKSIGCDPNAYGAMHPYRMEFEMYGMSFDRYADCMDTPGVQGCPPPDGGSCNDGLQVRKSTGLCDDPNADNPAQNMRALVAAEAGTPMNDTKTPIQGQDVRDAFCRSFFCDESFVCDLNTNNCVQCDPNKPYGQSGCGDVYTAGKLSCVYEPNLADNCDGPAASVDMPLFGMCM